MMGPILCRLCVGNSSYCDFMMRQPHRVQKRAFHSPLSPSSCILSAPSSVMLSELSELCYIGMSTQKSLILDTLMVMSLHQLSPMQVAAPHSKGEKSMICRCRHRYSDDKQQQSISSHLRHGSFTISDMNSLLDMTLNSDQKAVG